MSRFRPENEHKEINRRAKLLDELNKEAYKLFSTTDGYQFPSTCVATFTVLDIYCAELSRRLTRSDRVAEETYQQDSWKPAEPDDDIEDLRRELAQHSRKEYDAFHARKDEKEALEGSEFGDILQ